MKNKQYLDNTIKMLTSMRIKLTEFNGDTNDLKNDIDCILLQVRNYKTNIQNNEDLKQEKKVLSKLMLLIKLFLTSDDLN